MSANAGRAEGPPPYKSYNAVPSTSLRWGGKWLLPLVLALPVFSACAGKDSTAPSMLQTPVAALTVAPATATVPVGQTMQLAATTKDANGNVLTGRTVAWATGNAAVATVNGSGLVTGVAAGGPVTITATSEGQSGTAAVSVSPVPVASVAVTPATATVPVGQTVQLTATTKDANGNVLTGRTVTWATSNAALATVSGSGLVRGVAAGGPVTITATSEGQSGTAAVTVIPAPVASVTVAPATATVSVGQTVQLAATTKDVNGNVLTGRTVTWATSNAALATVNGSGLVTGVAAGGPVTITAMSEGQSGTAAVTVTPPSGDLYVSTLLDGSVLHYNSNGQLLHSVATSGTGGVWGIAFGPDCNLYVSLQGVFGAGVAVYSGVNDALLGVFVPAVIGTSPGPIRFGADGSLYVVNIGGTLAHYDARGQLLNSFALSALATGFMAFSNGIVYLSANFGTTFGVLSLNVQTGVQSKFVDLSPGSPAGITFDGSGNFYAVETVSAFGLPNLSEVLRFTSQGASQVFVPLLPQSNGGLGEATDLAFGADGNLYVLSRNGNQVLKYRGTDGSFAGAFAAIPAAGLAGEPIQMAFKPLTCP